MRWFALVVLLFVSGGVGAFEVLLISGNNPEPLYPLALFRAGVTGDVLVRFTAHADGSVDKVSILQSDHPDLTEAVRAAIAQWRFKPWTVEGDKPAEKEVLAPMAFRLDLDQPIHINQQLKVLKCRTVNDYLANTPEYAWIDSQAFSYVRGYLSNVFNKTQLPDAQRLAMIARMNKRVPIIVRGCRDSPARRFMSFLPEDIRNLL